MIAGKDYLFYSSEINVLLQYNGHIIPVMGTPNQAILFRFGFVPYLKDIVRIVTMLLTF